MAYAHRKGTMPVVTALEAAFLLPWTAFVGAFLYYTLLTLMVIGAANLSGMFVAVAYLLPVAAYAGVLGLRAMRALAALPIEIGETPHALQH